MIAAGRAAFDTLRLEKGYRLWGNDMHTEYTPSEAGLGWAVKLAKGPFIGRDAIVCSGRSRRARLCCLTLTTPGAVVMGKEPIWAGGEVAGYVTSADTGSASGGASPTATCRRR